MRERHYDANQHPVTGHSGPYLYEPVYVTGKEGRQCVYFNVLPWDGCDIP